MLRNFRQVFKGNQTPMAVIMMVVLLGLVAYLAPSGGSLASPDNVLARAYGRDVLKREMDVMVSQYIKRQGKGVDLESQMGYIQDRVLENLITLKLREELAERHGIVVTDDEIRQALEARLKSIPLFQQENGQLKTSTEINSILREYETSLKDWEKEIASDLSMRKLMAQAAAKVPVDPAWVEREHRVRDEKLTFDFVTLAPDPASVQDPGDAKLQAFLKDSGARFQEGPRRVVQVVVVDKASLGLPPVDEAKVKALYEARKGQYQELKARHILFMAKTEAEAAEALKKAQETRVKLVAGQDFAKTAETLSEDPSAKGRGGDLGWFAPSTMAKAFSAAAGALKEGEISQPVRTEFGVHLIRLEGRRVKPYEELKDELSGQLARDAYALKAKDKLEQLRKRAGDRGDLSAPARNLGLKLQTSKPVASDATGIEGLPGSGGVISDAFHLAVGQVSKVRTIGASYGVYRVQEETPVTVPPLQEIRAKVLAGWKQEESRRAAQVKAQQAGGNLQALGTPETKDSVTVTSLGALGQHPGIRTALLDTPAGSATAPLWTPDGKLWVARIKARTPAAPLTFETRRTLVEAIQSEVAEKMLTAELMSLSTEGKLHPGFTSLYGRLGGIWRNDEAMRKIAGDVPDAAPDMD